MSYKQWSAISGRWKTWLVGSIDGDWQGGRLNAHAQAYWASPGCQFWASMASAGPYILNTLFFMNNGWYGLTAVFEFADNEDFRKTQLDEARYAPIDQASAPNITAF
jgi:hypothetical protein